MSSPVDVLADVIAAIESEGIVERFPVSADAVREARDAVAELVEASLMAHREMRAMRSAFGSGVLTDQAIAGLESALARCGAGA